jgi:hypothetical protein
MVGETFKGIERVVDALYEGEPGERHTLTVIPERAVVRSEPVYEWEEDDA